MYEHLSEKRFSVFELRTFQIQTNLLFLLQPTNAQLYITTLFLYIIYTATCFDIFMSSSGSFTFVPCQGTYFFFKLELLKSLFHK